MLLVVGVLAAHGVPVGLKYIIIAYFYIHFGDLNAASSVVGHVEVDVEGT